MNQWMTGMAQFFMHYGVLGLFILSFVEASFFPVPPYLLSIPMTLANPQLGLFYALVGTGGSLFGGLFGYGIGFRLGRPLLRKIMKAPALARVEGIYRRYGDWATAIGGLTPLPYKIFAISAGVFRTRLATFIPASIFARGIRFFGEAVLLILYGRKVLSFFESAFGPVNLIVFAVLLMILAALWRTRFIRDRLAPAFMRGKRQWPAWIARLRQRLFPVGIFSWYLISGATLTGFGFLLFAKIASELLEHELYHFDGAVGGWIIGFRSHGLTGMMRGLTFLGSTGWVIGLVIALSVVGILLRKRKSVYIFDIAMLGALLLTELLKFAFQRQRPAFPWLATASGYSFPSGHSLISFTLYGFLAYLIVRHCQKPKLYLTGSAALLLLPLLIGVSRVYLGVHYPSDVLAGWLVALGWIGTCITGVEFFGFEKPLRGKC